LEAGNHEELMQIEGGKYAHLFRLQSEGYAEFKNGKSGSTVSPPTLSLNNSGCSTPGISLP